MIALTGADIVLPDRLVRSGSVVIDGDRIAAIEPRVIDTPAGATRIDVDGCLMVPGFIDVHVHGVEGHDVLDGGQAVEEIARRLPRYGVTAFCPTSIACDPHTLSGFLLAVDRCGSRRTPNAARVLPAHLESNFINPEYKGAQPAECLRRPSGGPSAPPEEGTYSGDDIVETIGAWRAAVAIVTLAPEVDGALALVGQLSRAGHLVSIGHSGATYEQACAAFDAGVRHATHLFNRMSPMSHRAPGVPGAVLQSEQVAAELICDGHHVHPALMQLALRAKGVARVMAVTDGTAGAGLPVGARTHLGGRPIIVTERTAELEDGTLAGSVLTMDGAFRTLVQKTGVSLLDAATLCATSPARQLGLRDTGQIAVGWIADLAVLDKHLQVRHTVLSGTQWRNSATGQNV